MKKLKRPEAPFFIFQITGGIGKNILATCVLRSLKEKYPEARFVIVTAYQEPWLYNPDVYRVYTFQNATYFYDTYIKDQSSSRVFAIDPYQTEDYILKRKHLIDIWCELYGVECVTKTPQLYFNKREIEYFENKYLKTFGETYMVIQSNGGLNPDLKQSWYRDIPISTAQKIVNDFSQRMPVVHIRRGDQLPLENTLQFEGSMREAWLLIRYSFRKLFMDSMCQHAAAALGKRSTVLWIGNNPDILGYNLHDNIICTQTIELESSYKGILEPYNILGLIEECPFREEQDELFDTESIIDSLKKQ